MTVGGDIDRTAIHAAFSKIKEDMEKLTSELHSIKQDHKKLQQENIILKEKLFSNDSTGLDSEIITKIVKETLKNVQPKANANHSILRKINKNRKNVIVSRILSLAEKKNMSASDIKEQIVDTENLCSKATFYRYLEKLKKKNMLDFVKIDELSVIVKV
ncbi:MAG: transcriptional repressor [archaeon]